MCHKLRTDTKPPNHETKFIGFSWFRGFVGFVCSLT
jgi:hypothetical protein